MWNQPSHVKHKIETQSAFTLISIQQGGESSFYQEYNYCIYSSLNDSKKMHRAYTHHVHRMLTC